MVHFLDSNIQLEEFNLPEDGGAYTIEYQVLASAMTHDDGKAACNSFGFDLCVPQSYGSQPHIFRHHPKTLPPKLGILIWITALQFFVRRRF